MKDFDTVFEKYNKMKSIFEVGQEGDGEEEETNKEDPVEQNPNVNTVRGSAKRKCNDNNNMKGQKKQKTSVKRNLVTGYMDNFVSLLRDCLIFYLNLSTNYI